MGSGSVLSDLDRAIGFVLKDLLGDKKLAWTHRLAAVRRCSRIIGIDQGRIVEEGSHEALLARPKGLYAYLWALQTDQVTG